MIKHFTLLLVTAFFTFSLVPALHAEDSDSAIGYFLAADESNVQQVYQWVQATDTSRQITHAEQDVSHFGVAYDGLSVAYLSDGQLWLQPLHTEEPESLAEVKATENLGDPVYSPDGQLIAYPDGGMWLLDLATRETRQLVANVPLAEGATNADTFRIYKPQRFVVDAEGNVTRLIIDIGVWEWNTVGVYDLAMDTLQEFKTEYSQLHNDLLPLHNGQVLIFGNNPVGGETSLELAGNLRDINTFTRVVDLAKIADDPLWSQEAVEITPGVVRLFGTAFHNSLEEQSPFIFDYDINTGTTGDVIFFSPVDGPTVYGPLSPHGQWVSVYTYQNDEDTTQFSLLNLETGDLLQTSVPTEASNFQWQPQA